MNNLLPDKMCLLPCSARLAFLVALGFELVMLGLVLVVLGLLLAALGSFPSMLEILLLALELLLLGALGLGFQWRTLNFNDLPPSSTNNCAKPCR